MKRISGVFGVLVLTLLLWTGSRSAWAQSGAVFTHEVDVLDEFIARFNNQDSLLFQAFTNAKKKNFTESRTFLIKSLFDFSSKNWRSDDVKNFIRTVNDSTAPVYLNFGDNNWYAELICSITYKGKPEKANLILKFEERADGSSRWAIAAVKAPFLAAYRDSVPPIPSHIDQRKGLVPSSHGNDFISLYRAFDDAANIRSYLVHETLNRDMQHFIRAFLKKQMQLVQIDRVTYHFLQVDGWIFTVNNYPHRKSNAGWLINQLMPANAALKQQYKNKILNLN